MIGDALRGLIGEHWRELEMQATSTPHTLRVSELPVESANGPLAAAVDHDGRRHLLVPIGTQKRIRRSLEGPALTLRKRSLEGEDFYQGYADLACVRIDLNDVFTGLCADVLRTTETLPENPIKALYIVLDRWKALLQTTGTPLSAEQLAGLFAELTVLKRLLEIDAGAHMLWSGPHGHRHDFTNATRAVEVKASIATEGRRVRIHGLDQLEPPEGGSLKLAFFRLERTLDYAEGLVELAKRTVHLCEDESALLALLAGAGFRIADSETYRDVRYAIVEERWYEVGSNFPKLVGHDLAAAGIPIAVLDVHYTIDLSSEPPTPMDDAQMNDHLAHMIQESV
jgi:hypothetical protein